MKSFIDLQAWQCGMELTKEIYKLTCNFPKGERFEMVKQMRRASASVLANIAEGFSRFSAADKKHKYIIARGECSEVQAFLYIAAGIGCATEADIQRALDLCDRTGRCISGLIRSHAKTPSPHSPSPQNVNSDTI